MTRFARILITCVAATCGAFGAPSVAWAADTDPAPAATTTMTASTTPDGVPRTALDVAIDLHRVDLKLTPVQSQLRSAQVRVQTAQAAVDQTMELLATQQQRQATVQNRVRKRAAVAYVHSGLQMDAVFSVPEIQDSTSAREYAKGATEVDTADLASIDKVVSALQGELHDRQAALASIESDTQTLSTTLQQLTARETSDQQRLDAWNAIPVMGDAWLTASEMAAWYQSSGAVPKLAAGTSIRDLAQMYLDEGADEGVRGDLAFAQSIVETASFSVAAGNNFSGIGVCDSCTGGYAFPTPRDGVRAQIQLLRNYADPDSRASNLDHAPSPALYGSDADRAAKLYDSFFLKGKAPIWNVMGNGNWATSTTYARSVVTVYAQMLDFAKAHPS